jgi:exopolysaccharide biosynthesis polyprenyl glycosylphosphotransferase
LLAPLAALVFAIYLIDGYRVRTDMIGADYTSQHVIAVVSAMLATLLLTYAFIPAGYELQTSRRVIALSFGLLLPITLGYRRTIYQRIVLARGPRSLVFIGRLADCEIFREECRKMHAAEPVIFVAPFETAAAGSPIADNFRTGSPPLAGLDLRPLTEVLDAIDRDSLSVGAIILRESNRELQPEIAERLVQLHFRGVPTYTLELFHQIHWRKIPLYRLNPTWLFQEGFEITREPVFERLKRASDIVFAACGLVLITPVIAAAAVAIRMGDHGPVFFRQMRVGKNRVPFRMVKLRTMRTDIGPGDPYTHPGDPRVTRVGRFLRSSRLDELPQLWNVLRGEMSLIGPRAEWDRLVEEYERQIPCYNFRHLVKPGITGWAQVNFLYGATLDDTIRKLEYDLYYIRYFSFTLDASIVLKTIHVMLFGKGQ